MRYEIFSFRISLFFVCKTAYARRASIVLAAQKRFLIREQNRFHLSRSPAGARSGFCGSLHYAFAILMGCFASARS